MKISGKCRIANQWIDGQVNKSLFQFENKGKFAKGRLTWSDIIKGKNGEKDTFVSSSKKFICFGDNIKFIENNLGQQLEIVGKLKTESFKNGTDKVVTFDQITIEEVKLAETKQSEHHQAKSNGYQPQADDLADDTIPW